MSAFEFKSDNKTGDSDCLVGELLKYGGSEQYILIGGSYLHCKNIWVILTLEN